MINTNEPDSKQLSTGLLLLGGVIFLFGQLCPLFVPLVALSHWSTAWKTSISGLLVFGVPEIFMLISVAIVGQTGFKLIKEKIFASTRILTP
ncbi:hypothetical protein [Gloeothece verrucosa]|uniref:Uncharacterized protein n=1 Tax=Gloeothece verrucosa (strain PCC 7822) TaxID=497965 RepID=E0UGT2_GLOV7|nr:hypothetical protein [Gloeothece verrucosa]ADN14413.1 hypothetical protein Cyan7822_2438 [Gloeothece verrucosa PCC 7822]